MERKNSPVLHHIEMCVGEESSILKILTTGFGFRISHYRSTQTGFQWVLTSEKIVFIVTKGLRLTSTSNEPSRPCNVNDCNGFERNGIFHELPENFEDILEQNSYPLLFCRCTGDSHHIDSVFNVSLEVKNVEDITAKIKSKGGKVICDPYTIKDEHGILKLSVVASECENVVHSLLDKSQYSGGFLPGFKDTEFQPSILCSKKLNEREIALTKYVDHLTYVCRPGDSSKIIRWYEECFGMKRFFSNRQDTEEEGFVLREGIGLRLKAMQYWRCAESGVGSPANLDHAGVLRIVLAEPLPGIEDSHVEKFLKENSGPGVQHVGFSSGNIVRDVTEMKRRGVNFRNPPPTYYEECGKLNEIVEVGLAKDLDELRTSGILLDCEEGFETDDKNRYLLQIFTRPVFEKDTFFLEVIQRRGAIGFGAGNITALARSIIVYQKEMQRKSMKIAQ